MQQHPGGGTKMQHLEGDAKIALMYEHDMLLSKSGYSVLTAF